MNKLFGIITVVAIGVAITFTSCKKDEKEIKPDYQSEISLKSLETDVIVKGGGEKEDYTKVVVEDLVKKEECKWEVVSGIIEYYYQEELVFAINFGDGQCDGIASVSWVEEDGTTGSKDVDVWILFKKDDKEDYKRVVSQELIKSNECNGEIVSGLIEYYDYKENWVASIDFGNGECDGIATKCWINKETNNQECEDFDVLLWKEEGDKE